jgi:hypothetical protein
MMGLRWVEDLGGSEVDGFQARKTESLPHPFHLPSILIYLGFERNELLCKSWYGLLHPEDLAHASAQHYRLCECPERLQIRQGAGKGNGRPEQE